MATATAVSQSPPNGRGAEFMKVMKGLSDRMGTMEQQLKALRQPASQVSVAPGQIMTAGFVPAGTEHSWESPHVRKALDRLSKAYTDEVAVNFMAKTSDGRLRGIGWGPMLRDMAFVKSGGKTGYGGQYTTNDELEKAYNAQSIQKYNTVRKTALAEGSGLTGGYVVPPDFRSELLTIEAEETFVQPRSKVMPMTTRTMQIPMLDVTTTQTTGTSPYFGGILASWQPEAATINETEPQFKQTELTAWDLVLYTVSSNQLLADNAIGLDALLTQLFGAAMAWYKEYAFLRGTGAGNSMPQGVLNAPATYSVARTIASHFILPDAANMLSRLQMRSMDSACWIMHQSVLPDLIQMNDNTGAQRSGAQNVGNMLSWVNPLQTSGDGGPLTRKLPRAFLNSLPLYITEKVPTLGTKGDVMLCDFSHYVIGNRLEVQIDVSDQYLFRNNQLAWRVVCRVDGRPWLNSTIKDSQGYEVSPFVVLNVP